MKKTKVKGGKRKSPIINEVVKSDFDLDATVKLEAEGMISDFELDGLMIIGLKDGIFAPHVLARSVPDLLTLKFVLEREISRVIEATLKTPQI